MVIIIRIRNDLRRRIGNRFVKLELRKRIYRVFTSLLFSNFENTDSFASQTSEFCEKETIQYTYSFSNDKEYPGGVRNGEDVLDPIEWKWEG